MKELAGLRIRQRSVERLGCIKGCLEYLGSEISFPWLYGGAGHAFIIRQAAEADAEGLALLRRIAESL